MLINIKMFGSFYITIGGKYIVFKKNNGSRTSFLLQYLIQNSGKSITKEKLIDVIYGDEEIENPVKALQVLVTRLRKILLDSGLPKQEYIYCSDGMYGWNTKIPCEIDTHEFEIAVNKARQQGQTYERKIELYTRAIELYDGDFLPNLTGNDWATVVSAYYSNLYLQCFEEVWVLLRGNNDYQTMLKLCSKGMRVTPSEEELHIIYIRCLLGEGRIKDALTAYNFAMEMLLDEWLTVPSAELEALFGEISDKLKDERLPIKEIRDEIKEKAEQEGAFYCTLMSFIDSYRFVARMMERSGQSVYLMLCTLTNKNGGLPKSDERLSYAAKCLSDSVKKSLRRGDMYTRYSVTQFLVLLIGTNMENCTLISERINANYRKLYNGRGIHLKCSVLPAAEFNFNGDKIKFIKNHSFWE